MHSGGSVSSAVALRVSRRSSNGRAAIAVAKGRLSLGGGISTVTSKSHDSENPFFEAVQVTLVVPAANSDPAGGAQEMVASAGPAGAVKSTGEGVSPRASCV